MHTPAQRFTINFSSSSSSSRGEGIGIGSGGDGSGSGGAGGGKTTNTNDTVLQPVSPISILLAQTKDALWCCLLPKTSHPLFAPPCLKLTTHHRFNSQTTTVTLPSSRSHTTIITHNLPSPSCPWMMPTDLQLEICRQLGRSGCRHLHWSWLHPHTS